MWPEEKGENNPKKPIPKISETEIEEALEDKREQEVTVETEEAGQLMKKHYKLVTKTKKDSVRFLNTYSEFLRDTGRDASKEGWRFVEHHLGIDYVPGKLPEGIGKEPSEETFWHFSIWMLKNKARQDLNKFTVALNMAHERVFRQPKREHPWARREIKDIKKAYETARKELIETQKSKGGAPKKGKKKEPNEEKNEPLRQEEIIEILEICEGKRTAPALSESNPPDFNLWGAVVLLNFLTATRPHSLGCHQSGNPDGLQRDVQPGPEHLQVMIRGYKGKAHLGTKYSIAKKSRFETQGKNPERYTIPREGNELRSRMINVIAKNQRAKNFEKLMDLKDPETGHHRTR
jgi:hypothetical protein